MTAWGGVGYGFGAYVNASTPNYDVSVGGAAYVAIGYHQDYGWNVRASAQFSGPWGSASVNASYYFDSGVYSVGAGYSGGYGGVSVGYSNASGWSAGVSTMASAICLPVIASMASKYVMLYWYWLSVRKLSNWE